MTSPAILAGVPGRRRPLDGKRVILTRPAAQAGDFEQRVAALGGKPVIAPAIAIAAPDSWTIADAALRRIGTYDWIAFTSANAVRAFLERADAIGVARDELQIRRLAVVGPATAALVGTTLRPPDVVASVHTSASLGREVEGVENARVLLPRGDLADDALPTALRGRGAFIDEIVVYRTIPGTGIPTIVASVREASADALLFASASAVRFVVNALVADAGGLAGDRRSTWPVAACLGPVTASAARESGFEHVLVAEGTTQAGLIDRIASWFARSQHADGGLR